MNEEMKIIIKAVTDGAKKEIGKVSKQLEGLGGSAKGASGKVGAAMKGIAKGAAVAVGAIVAVGTAIVALGKSTLDIQKNFAKLSTAFEAGGSSAQQAEETYKDLYRFLGDSDKATEAAAHLAKITTSQQELAEWSKIAQGVYATFGDSLPIEGLTEAANETLRVGKVTGVMADALNWAGVSEDEMNAKLAQATTLEEREAILRSTLNGLYDEAASIYEKNNQALLDYNASQAELDVALASAGKATMPLLTALNNLGSAFFTALKPALDVIVPILASFVNMIAQAIQAVMSFFSALTGKSSTIKAVGEVGNGLKSAATGAQKLGSGMGGAEKAAGGAAKAAEELKKSTQGFDELNIVSSGKGSGGGSSGGGGGASAPGYAGGGSGLLDPVAFGTEVETVESGASSLVEGIKETFGQLKEVFAPSIEAWAGAFETVKEAWNTAKPDFINGASEIVAGFTTIGEYLLSDFIPNVVNAFSVNIAPIIGDVLGFAIQEVGAHFSWMGETFNTVTNDLLIPTAQTIESTLVDVLGIVGEAWATHGEALLTQLSGFFDSIRGHFDNLYNVVIKPIWDKVIEVFNNVWDKIKPIVESIVNSFMEIGEELLILYNEVIAPVFDWIIKNIFPIFVNTFNKIIEVVGNIYVQVVKVVDGVVTALKGIIQFIVGVFTGDWGKAWEGIKNFFGGIWDAIVGIAGAAWEAIKGVFSVVGEFFSGIWEGIKNIFSGVAEWFKGIFTSAWEGIKSVFSKVGDFFGGIWNTIKSKFTQLGTKIGDAISKSVKAGINGVISSIEKIINKGIGLINGAIKLINKIPGVSIGKLQELKLPKLAKGGVINSATIAMIGEAGKEAVVPLENNTEWMDRLADRISQRSAAPSKIVLTLDGKELGWANINSINNITKQTGSLQLVMA